MITLNFFRTAVTALAIAATAMPAGATVTRAASSIPAVAPGTAAPAAKAGVRRTRPVAARDNLFGTPILAGVLGLAAIAVGAAMVTRKNDSNG